MRPLILLSILLLSHTLEAQTSCATALPVDLGIHTVNTLTQGDPPPVACISGPATPQHAAWYTYTATSDTAIRITSAVQGNPSGVYTRVQVYSGDCGNLSCVVGDVFSGPNSTSLVEFLVTSGVTYHILWDDLFGANTFLFEVSAFQVPEGFISFVLQQTPFIEGVMGVVDMDQDGLDDLVVPGQTSVRIGYQQQGGFQSTSYLTTQADHQATWSFAVGDYDGNGWRDLLYGGGQGATFMRANATGTGFDEISFSQYIFSQRTNFVDLNNDGHLDAFVCHDVDANVAFINDGAGNLTFTQGGYGETCGNYGSLFTDMDNDGDQDLFVAKCGCDPADLLMPNDGSGVFTDLAPALGLNDGHQSWSGAWGDYDNDGDMDVLIGSSGGGGHKLLLNDGTGSFTNATTGSGMDTWPGSSTEWTAHDFNNDGWIDILGGNALHLNQGDLTFIPDDSAPLNGAVGDITGDGFLDIVSYNQAQRNTGNENNHIRFNLQGVQSNRDGIGARVTITSALGTQIRDIRSGDGFRYMSFIGAHFGLGTDDAVEQVHIRWPSGIEDVIINPAINTSHTIVEGISTSVNADPAAAIALVPNPATDHITVSGVAPNSAVNVLDAAGRLVLNGSLLAGRLDISGLKPGLYQVLLTERSTAEGLRFAKE
jgi:hypothetical protein